MDEESKFSSTLVHWDLESKVSKIVLLFSHQKWVENFEEEYSLFVHEDCVWTVDPEPPCEALKIRIDSSEIGKGGMKNSKIVTYFISLLYSKLFRVESSALDTS